MQSLSLNAKFVLVDGTVTGKQKQTQTQKYISSHLIQSLSLNANLSIWLIVHSDRQKQTQDRQKYISSHLRQSLSLNAKLVLVDGTDRHKTDMDRNTSVLTLYFLFLSLYSRCPWMPSLCWLMAQSVIQTETDTDINTSALTLYSRCPWMSSLSIWFLGAECHTDRNRHRHTHISSRLMQPLSLNVKFVNMVSGCRVTDKNRHKTDRNTSALTLYSRCPWMPSLSWLIAITRLLSSRSRDSGLMLRRSLDM